MLGRDLPRRDEVRKNEKNQKKVENHEKTTKKGTRGGASGGSAGRGTEGAVQTRKNEKNQKKIENQQNKTKYGSARPRGGAQAWRQTEEKGRGGDEKRQYEVEPTKKHKTAQNEEAECLTRGARHGNDGDSVCVEGKLASQIDFEDLDVRLSVLADDGDDLVHPAGAIGVDGGSGGELKCGVGMCGRSDSVLEIPGTEEVTLDLPAKACQAETEPSAWWLNGKCDFTDGKAREIAWLVDTGAAGTILSKQWCKDKGWDCDWERLPSQQQRRPVSGVSGSGSIVATELVQCKISVQLDTLEWVLLDLVVHLTEGPAHPPLLGMDNLRSWHAVLHLAEGRMFLNGRNQCVPFSTHQTRTKQFPVYLACDVRFDPAQGLGPAAAMVNGKTDAPDGQYELVPRTGKPLQAMPTLVRVEQGKLVVPVSGGEKWKVWQAGFRVGHLQILPSRVAAAAALRAQIVDTTDEEDLSVRLQTWRASVGAHSEPASQLEEQIVQAQEFVTRQISGTPVPAAEWRERLSSVVGDSDVSEHQRTQFLDMLVGFSDVFEVSMAAAVGVECVVETTPGVIVNEPVRPLHAAKKEAVLEVIAQWERLGIVEVGQSNWNQPLVVVRKPNGSWRVCLDLRQLNAATAPIRLAVPSRLTIQLENTLRGARFFSTMDLKDAFLHVSVREEDRAKFAFQATNGGPKYVFNRMIFGFVNAPAVLQSFMVQLCGKLDFEQILCYLDDLLTWSDNFDDHLSRVKALLQVLRDAQLTVGWKKCAFLQKEVPYLGRIVSGDGMKVDPVYVQALLDLEFPSSAKLLESALASFGWLRDFLPRFEHLVAPLRAEFNRVKSTRETKTSRKAKGRRQRVNALPVKETVELSVAWKALKQAAADCTLLAFPAYGDDAPPFIVEVDASDTALFGVLLQKDRPLGYFARGVGRTSPVRVCKQFRAAVVEGDKVRAREVFLLHAYERELGAVVQSLQHFEPMIWAAGVPVIVKTDHKALLWLASTSNTNRKYIRWQQYLGSFPNLTLEHVAGVLNNQADMGSRLTPAGSLEEVAWLELDKMALQEKLTVAPGEPMAAMVMTRAMAKLAASQAPQLTSPPPSPSPIPTPSLSPVSTPTKVTKDPPADVRAAQTEARMGGDVREVTQAPMVAPSVTVPSIAPAAQLRQPVETTSPETRSSSSTQQYRPLDKGLFCVCQERDSLTREWVYCDRCDLPFHQDCMGITDATADFVCPLCTANQAFEEGRAAEGALPSSMWLSEHSLPRLVSMVKRAHVEKSEVVQNCIREIKKRASEIQVAEVKAVQAERRRLGLVKRLGQKAVQDLTPAESTTQSSNKGKGKMRKKSQSVAPIQGEEKAVAFVDAPVTVESKVVQLRDGTTGIRDEWLITSKGAIFAWVKSSSSPAGGNWALWVPDDKPDLREMCVKWAHCSELAGHGGNGRTLSFLTREFYWTDSLRAMVNTVVQGCAICTAMKKRAVPKWQLAGGSIDSGVLAPNDMVCGDFMRMTPCRGYIGIYVLIDVATRFVLLVPLKQETSETYLSVLRTWYYRYGLPKQLHLDNFAPQQGSVFREWCQINGVQVSYIAPGNSGGNGIAERTVRSVRESFRVLGFTEHLAVSFDWIPKVEEVTAVLNHHCHSSTGLAPLDLFPSGPRRFLARALEEEDLLDDSLRNWHVTPKQKLALEQQREHFVDSLVKARETRQMQTWRSIVRGAGRRGAKRTLVDWGVGDVVSVINRELKVTASQEAHHMQVNVPLLVREVDVVRGRVYGTDAYGKHRNYAVSDVVQKMGKEQGELLFSLTRRSYLKPQREAKQELEDFLDGRPSQGVEEEDTSDDSVDEEWVELGMEESESEEEDDDVERD